MASLPPPPLPFTERQTGYPEPLPSLRDDAIAAPPGAAAIGSCTSSPPLAPVYDAMRGSSLLVPPRTDSNRGSLGGCLENGAQVGIAHRRGNSCSVDVGAGAVRGRWTSRSLSYAVPQQGLYPPRRWRARSAARSTAALRSPSPLSSSAAATSTLSPVVLQGTTAGPCSPTAATLGTPGNPPPGGGAVGSASLLTGPHQVSAHPTQVEWDGVVGGSTAANFDERTSCERSSTCFLGRHSSSPADPRAPPDAPRSSCTRVSNALSPRHNPLQWSAASAPTPTRTLTDNLTALSCTPAVWWTSTPPLMRSSPATHENSQRDRFIGSVDARSHQHLISQPRFSWADPGVLGGATGGAAPLSRESAIPLSASHRAAHSMLCLGSSPPIVSEISVAARTEAFDVVHGDRHHRFSRDASVATLRGSDQDVKAAAAEHSDIHRGRRMQQHPCFHQEGEGASTVDTSAFSVSFDASSRADDGYTARQSLSSRAADSLSHQSSTQPPPPSPPSPPSSPSSSSLADHAVRLDSKDMDRSAHHRWLRSYDDSAVSTRNPGGGDEDGTDYTSAIFPTGVGGVAPELVRTQRDVRLPLCCSVVAHNAEASPGDTVHSAHVDQCVVAGACSEAVVASDAQAPLGVPVDATPQREGNGASAPSHSSSISTLSQEWPRSSPSSSATAVRGSCPRYRSPKGLSVVPSTSLEDLGAMAPDTTEPSCVQPFAHGTYSDLPHGCPNTLANSLDTGRTSATTTHLRLPTSTSSSALPPRSASVATQQPSTTPPVSEHGRDEGGERVLEDAATGSTKGSTTPWFYTARSLSPTSPTRSSASRSLAAVARLKCDQDRHGAVGEVTCAVTAHPPPRAPVVTSSLAKTAHVAAPALPSWKAERQGQLLTPPVGGGSESAGVGILPAATWAMQGRSPRTPRGQRESPLVSLVRVALIDARSVRSHLDELRALFPKNSAAVAGGNAVQSIHRGVAGNSELVAATSPDSAIAAAISGASDMRDGPHPGESGGVRAGAWEPPTRGMDEMFGGAVDCKAAVSPFRSSVLQRTLRVRGARDGAEGHQDRVVRRDVGGGRDSSRDWASGATDAPPQRGPQSVSQEVGDSDSDGHSGRSPAPTFDVGGLYTSSLNGYRHQRLTRLTQQHLQSLFVGVSSVAKLVCGIEVEQCAQMGVAEGLGWVDDHVPDCLCEEAATIATPPVATVQSSFSPAVVSAVPTPRAPREARDDPISASSEGAATVPRVSRDASEALRQPNVSTCAARHSHLSAVVQELAAEHHAPLGCHKKPLVTEGRGNSPSSCRSDSQSRCIAVTAVLPSGSVVGGDRSTSTSRARPRVLATTADNVRIVGVQSEDVATFDSPSSAVVSTLGTTQAAASTNTNANANAVAASYCYSGHHHSAGRSTESPGSSSSSRGSSVSASGTIFIHPITQGSTSSVTTISSGLNDMGGNSGGNRMRYNSTSSSSSTRGGGCRNITCAARGVLGSASKSMAPATELTSGGGPSICTLPVTGLVPLQQHPPQHEQPPISLLHSAAPSSAACTTPPSGCDSPPVAWVGHHCPLLREPLASTCGVFPSTLPTAGLCCRSPSSANSHTSETDGTAASVDHKSGFPPAGETAVPTGTRLSSSPPPPPRPPRPPPSMPSPVASPPPASIHSGVAAATVRDMPGVPALPLDVERVLSSVGKGASDSARVITPALDERYTSSVDEILENPFASPCSSAWMTSPLLATPTFPSATLQMEIHPKKKWEGEVVVEGMVADADTMPSLVLKVDVSDVQRTAATATAAVATMLGTSRVEDHDGGTAHMLLLTPFSLMVTRQEEVCEERIEEHSGPGPAAMDMATGAVASDTLPRAAGAVAEMPWTVLAAGDIPVCGDASAASPLHESTEPIACDIRGGSNLSASQSTATPMPMTILLPTSGGSESLSSSPMLRSVAAHATETATGFVSLTTDGCDGSDKEMFAAFDLLHRATTTTTPPSAHEPEDVSADTTATVSGHPSLSGSVSDIRSRGTATMSIMLSSSSASRRRRRPPPPPPSSSSKQHTVLSCAPAADFCDTGLPASEPHVQVATGVRGGDEASGGPSLTIVRSSHLSPQVYAEHGEPPVPSMLATSQLLFGTTSASSLSSSSSSAPCDGVSSQLGTCKDNGGAGDSVGAYPGLLWDALTERACGGAVAAELRDVASAPQEPPSGCESIVSLQTPQEPQSGRGAPSAVAHPHLISANTSPSTPRFSSFSSCTIFPWSTEGTGSIVVAAVPVEEACGPRPRAFEDLTATVRVEQQSWCGGDDASAPPPLPNTIFLSPDMCCHEGIPSRMKRDNHGNACPQQDGCTTGNRSSSSGVRDNVSQSPLRGPLLQGNEEQHPSLYAVSTWAPSSPSSMTAIHSSHCSGGFEAQRGPEEDGDTMDTLTSGKEQPSPCSDAVLNISGSRLPSSSPTMTVSAPPEVVHSVPEGGKCGCEANAFVMTLGDEEGVGDVPRPLDFTPTQFIHSTQGEMPADPRTGSIPVVPGGERDGTSATTVQTSCTARASVCVDVRSGLAAEALKGDGPRKNDAVVDYATSDKERNFDLIFSFTGDITHNGPHAQDGVLAQQPRCHQRPLSQSSSSILSISAVGSAATAGSPRATITDLVPSSAMPAPGQQRGISCSTAEMSRSSTAPALSVEVVPDVVDEICRAQGDFSDNVGAHPAVVAASTTTAAAAALCRVAMLASTTAAVGSSPLPQNSIVKFCSPSASAAWLTTPHLVSGTAACSSASHLLNPEGESSSGGDVTDGVLTIERPATSPGGQGKEFVFSLLGGASAPSQEMYCFSFSTTAAAAASDSVGGAACNMHFDAPGLGTTSNALPTFSTSTGALLHRLQLSAAVLPPTCYTFLMAEASSPLQRSASTSVASKTFRPSVTYEAASADEVRAREEVSVETPVLAASEDVTAPLSTPWYPATQPFPERPAGSSAIVVGPVTLSLGGDGGRTSLVDKSGLRTVSAVVEAGRPVSAGSLLPEGAAHHLSCGCSNDAVDITVRDEVAEAPLLRVGDSSGVHQRTSLASVTSSPPAQAAHRADAPEGGSTGSTVMSGPQGEVSRHEPVSAFADAAAAAPTWPSSSSLLSSSAGSQVDGVVCLHDAGAPVILSESLSPGSTDHTEAEVITSHRSAEAVGEAAAQKSEKQHTAAPTAASNAKRSAGALDTLDAFPIAPGRLASMPKRGPASAPSSEGLRPRVPPEVASIMRTPAQIFSTEPPESRQSPPSLSPNTHFSAPSYYLAQCEDGLADVHGSLHGWHTTASAFFTEAESAAVSCRAHRRLGGLSSGASTLYTSISTLARRRAQQRVFYDSAGLRGASPPASREHTVVRSLSPVSLAPLGTAEVFAPPL